MISRSSWINPQADIRDEAAEAGRFTSKLWHDKDYPRIQILTVGVCSTAMSASMPRRN